MQHGFMVDRNMPWRIIADIHSPYMQKYMEAYGVTADNLYDKYYSVAYNFDIELIKSSLVNMWNTLVLNRPRTRRALNGLGCGFEDRERVTKEKLESDYDDVYWTRIYTRFRNAESNVPLEEQSLQRMIKHATELTKALDISAAMSYINKEFQTPLLKERLAGYRFYPKNDQVEPGDEEREHLEDGNMNAVSNY